LRIVETVGFIAKNPKKDKAQKVNIMPKNFLLRSEVKYGKVGKYLFCIFYLSMVVISTERPTDGLFSILSMLIDFILG